MAPLRSIVAQKVPLCDFPAAAIDERQTLCHCHGCRNACASYSEKVAANYVLSIVYENLSCRQIAEEPALVSRRAAEAAGVQYSQATKDSVVTAGAIVPKRGANTILQSQSYMAVWHDPTASREIWNTQSELKRKKASW